MYRSSWLLPALALAACGTDNDQRPRTVEYITEAVLAPNCGNAQCHSSFANTSGYAFDTVDRAQRSLVGGLVGTITLNTRNEPEGDPTSSFLINVLTRTVDRMPYDQPLPAPDRRLIERWIEFGAPGAQCDPTLSEGMVCVGTKVVECQDTYELGAVLKDCAAMSMSCAQGACR
jgi:hypothetical protein